MTYKKTLAALVAGTLSVYGASAYAEIVTHDTVAPVSPDQTEAVKHAEQAVAAGKQGDAAGLLEHAEAAKKHAIMASKAFSSYKLQNAVDRLDDAITHGKQGHADVATTDAEEAVKMLKSDTPLDPNQP